MDNQNLPDFLLDSTLVTDIVSSVAKAKERKVNPTIIFATLLSVAVNSGIEAGAGIGDLIQSIRHAWRGAQEARKTADDDQGKAGGDPDVK